MRRQHNLPNRECRTDFTHDYYRINFLLLGPGALKTTISNPDSETRMVRISMNKTLKPNTNRTQIHKIKQIDQAFWTNGQNNRQQTR